MTNLELFDYSRRHPLPLIDPYYNKDKVVITPTHDEVNDLMRGNARLIELVTVFNYLRKEGRGEEDCEVHDVVCKIMEIMDGVRGINLSAFSQFFMVYNSAYSSYIEYDKERKRKFIYEMLCRYCIERHEMYLSHGYSDSMLQVVCDNYSHKRNSKSTIDKIADTLGPLGFSHFTSVGQLLDGAKGFLLPDKGDAEIFKAFADNLNLDLKAMRQEQGKLPDFVLKRSGEYYIGEAKMMKGSGGGQDKQLVEIINFIRYQEQPQEVHYLVYFDGEYANMLLSSSSRSPKVERQHQDIVQCLTANPRNYFLNPAGFEMFLAE